MRQLLYGLRISSQMSDLLPERGPFLGTHARVKGLGYQLADLLIGREDATATAEQVTQLVLADVVFAAVIGALLDDVHEPVMHLIRLAPVGDLIEHVRELAGGEHATVPTGNCIRPALILGQEIPVLNVAATVEVHVQTHFYSSSMCSGSQAILVLANVRVVEV